MGAGFCRGQLLAGDKLWRTVRRMGFYLCDACRLAGQLYFVAALGMVSWPTARRFAGNLRAGIILHLVLIAACLPACPRSHIANRLKAHIASLPNRPAAIALVGYHEPSAVFHLGQDILLLDVKQAALFMAEAPGGLAIIEERNRAEFIQLSEQLKQDLGVSDTLAGTNISKGRNIRLFFYQHSRLKRRLIDTRPSLQSIGI